MSVIPEIARDSFSARLTRNFDKFIRKSRLIIFGHILNAPWHSREQRRKRRYEVTTKGVLGYLQGFVPKSGFTPSLPRPRMEEEPERVFTIWLQGEESAPALVKSCFRSMRRELGREVLVLDEKTIFDWISLPDFIIEKWRAGKISPAHFTDICRVELLYEHGGLWFDSTDFVTANVPDNIMDADFFMFLVGDSVHFSYSFVQNCFIRSKKGAPLLEIWREAMFRYWRYENKVMDYFVHQLLFRACVTNNEEGATLFAEMPHIEQAPTHRLWFDHMNEPYERSRYQQITGDTFFQKTSYKSKGLSSVSADSMAGHIINL